MIAMTTSSSTNVKPREDLAQASGADHAGMELARRKPDERAVGFTFQSPARSHFDTPPRHDRLGDRSGRA